MQLSVRRHKLTAATTILNHAEELELMSILMPAPYQEQKTPNQCLSLESKSHDT